MYFSTLATAAVAMAGFAAAIPVQQPPMDRPVPTSCTEQFPDGTPFPVSVVPSGGFPRPSFPPGSRPSGFPGSRPPFPPGSIPSNAPSKPSNAPTKPSNAPTKPTDAPKPSATSSKTAETPSKPTETSSQPAETPVAKPEQVAILKGAEIEPYTCAATDKECRTAEQAAPYVFAGFEKYGVLNPKAQAAVLSLMSVESADFQFKRNKYPAPGRPGQGTANMQMPNYNLQYAQSIPELASKVPATLPAESDADGRNAILNLVNADEYNFASASWFLMESGKCTGVYAALVADIDAGFKSYMSCVGVDPENEDRLAALKRAKKAFKL